MIKTHKYNCNCNECRQDRINYRNLEPSVGDIVIVPVGTTNPYRVGLLGPERKRCIEILRRREILPTEYEVWYAPTSGGAYYIGKKLPDNVTIL